MSDAAADQAIAALPQNARVLVQGGAGESDVLAQAIARSARRDLNFVGVFLPGVSFRLEDGLATPALTHVRVIVAVTTYGSPRWRAFLLGDPPRKVVMRMLRVLVAPMARRYYLALHDMNRQTPEGRDAFLRKVAKVIAAI